MGYSFDTDHERTEMAALNAQDAVKGIDQVESTAHEDSRAEPQSAFDDDSDDDVEDIDDDDAQNKGTANEDNSWLGSVDEDVSALDDDTSDQYETTPTDRPTALDLDQSPKRSRDSDETEDDLEDQYSSEYSPRTAKRLRTEYERGYEYDDRPLTAFLLNGDEVIDSLVRRRKSPRGRYDVKGKRMGKLLPPFPDLPARVSPLGLDFHVGAAWKGHVFLPLTDDGEVIVEEGEEEEVDAPDDAKLSIFRDDDNDRGDDAHPPRPSTPSPDSDDEEEGQYASSYQPNSQPGDDNYSDRLVESTASTASSSFGQAAVRSRMSNWADEADDEFIFDPYVPGSSSATDDTSTTDDDTAQALDDEPTTEIALTDSTNVQHQDELQIEGGEPADAAVVASTSSSSSPGHTEPSPSIPRRPAAAERHPSSMATGREVGQLSAPTPRDDELAQLKLENARLLFSLRGCEDREEKKDEQWRQVWSEKTRLENDHRDLLVNYDGLLNAFRRLQNDHQELQGELLDARQRAEYDAEQLAAERAAEDAQRLAYITNLQQEAQRMRIWAERLDADAEPTREVNDDLTAKLEDAEKFNAALQQQLENANTTIATLRDEKQKSDERNVELAAQVEDLSTAPIATTHSPTNPQSHFAGQPAMSTSSLFSPRMDQTPRPAFTLPPLHETREAREARWRNLGARSAAEDSTQIAQRQARRVAVEQYNADRELRLQAYRAATGREYVEGDASLRRSALVGIVIQQSSPQLA